MRQCNRSIEGFIVPIPSTLGSCLTAKNAAVTQFSSFLYGFGGQFIDKNGKSAISSAAAKQAYAYYGGLIRNYGPANVSTDMSWPEAMAIFTQGNAGLYTEADSLYKNATDPAKSKVAEPMQELAEYVHNVAVDEVAEEEPAAEVRLGVELT